MTPEQREILDRLPVSALVILVRVARRVLEGYEGEVTLMASRGGIGAIRWVQVERTGDVIREGNKAEPKG